MVPTDGAIHGYEYWSTLVIYRQMLKRPPHTLVTRWRRVRGPRVPSNFVPFRDGAVVRAVLGREAADRLHERTEWGIRSQQVRQE
ncbi:MAG: hypothetical protein RL042_1703 [Nitrospirota bacterium]|jgi:hypothetical protein